MAIKQTDNFVQPDPIGHLASSDEQKQRMAFLQENFPPVFFDHFRHPDDYQLITQSPPDACLSDIGNSSIDCLLSNFWILLKEDVSPFVENLSSVFRSQLSGSTGYDDGAGVFIGIWIGDGNHAIVASFSNTEEWLDIQDQPLLYANPNLRQVRQVGYDTADNSMDGIWDSAAFDAKSDASFPLRELALMMKNMVDPHSLCEHMKSWIKQGLEMDNPPNPADPWLAFRYLIEASKNTGKPSLNSLALLQSIISSDDLKDQLGHIDVSSKPTHKMGKF